MKNDRSARLARVREALSAAGLADNIRILQDNTATAAQAAQALGCAVGEIAKSLMFRRRRDDAPILAVLSGAARVDIKKLSRAVDGDVSKADADFVKTHSGYEIGGVPPLGHVHPPITIFDQGLQDYAVVWAAAGSPFAVFAAVPNALANAAKATVADIAE